MIARMDARVWEKIFKTLMATDKMAKFDVEFVSGPRKPMRFSSQVNRWEPELS